MPSKLSETKVPDRPSRSLFFDWNRPTVQALLDGLERNRPFAVVLLAALVMLFFLAMRGLGGKLPSFPKGRYPMLGSVMDVPLEHVASMLHVSAWPRFESRQESANPFFTTYFQPPPPAPAPKLPTTRKVDLVYQGFFETPVGERHAFVKVGDGLVVGPPGTKVVADLAVKEMDLRALTMTNQSAQTNILEFNRKKTIEVPMP